MIRIAVSVEGITEKEFCNNVLKPYFEEFGVQLVPIIIETSRKRSGKKYCGGDVKISKIIKEVNRLLSSFDYVTTLYDFYGFKGNWQTVDEIENKLLNQVSSHRFIPYIQKYEFETFLFSKPEYFKEVFNQGIFNEIDKIIKQFPNIEDINNSFQTAPSKRIEKIFYNNNEKYDKVFYGSSIAEDIGLDTLRQKVKRFDKWLKKLEGLIKK